jgi:transcriptional regulator with XRE-family HTH domain
MRDHLDSPAPDARAELGRVLRDARQSAGIKLRVAAARARTSPTTLSLLERGQRAAPAEVLERLITITGVDASQVFRLAGTVPSRAAADVLGPEFSTLITSGGLTKPARSALRRAHLLAVAAKISPGADFPPVDIEEVLDREFSIEVRPAADAAEPRFATPELVEYDACLDDPSRRAERDLILGHMSGHAVLGREAGRRPICTYSAGGSIEAQATWLAGLLLMPRHMLESEAQLLAGTYDVATSEGVASFVAEVAGAFAVPAWIAARHLADAGLLAWAAGLEEP